MNGMNGWSIFSNVSKNLNVASYVSRSIGWACPSMYAGLIISRYQLENSSQNNLYTTINASEMRYLLKRSFNSALACFNLASNQATAILFASFSKSATSQPFTRRKAFQILLLKLRPCSQSASSNKISFPAGAESIIPIRTPSAPNLSMSSNGSGELPNDLDILRPSLSRTIPVKYTFLKGNLPMYSSPAIIIRATQKKIISGAVTRSLVG